MLDAYTDAKRVSYLDYLLARLLVEQVGKISHLMAGSVSTIQNISKVILFAPAMQHGSFPIFVISCSPVPGNATDISLALSKIKIC